MASSDNFWTVAELRIYSLGKELMRSPGWRLSAQPNGWEVQLAFDNVSVVIRGTLVQTLTPQAMRGRVGAVNIVFVSSSNEMGAFESGATAAR